MSYPGGEGREGKGEGFIWGFFLMDGWDGWMDAKIDDEDIGNGNDGFR